MRRTILEKSLQQSNHIRSIFTDWIVTKNTYICSNINVILFDKLTPNRYPYAVLIGSIPDLRFSINSRPGTSPSFDLYLHFIHTYFSHLDRMALYSRARFIKIEKFPFKVPAVHKVYIYRIRVYTYILIYIHTSIPACGAVLVVDYYGYYFVCILRARSTHQCGLKIKSAHTEQSRCVFFFGKTGPKMMRRSLCVQMHTTYICELGWRVSFYIKPPIVLMSVEVVMS